MKQGQTCRMKMRMISWSREKLAGYGAREEQESDIK